jgi:hypothetical protein
VAPEASRVSIKVYESTFAVAYNDHPLSIARARQLSHDAVIASTGQARRSGVTWTHRPLTEWFEALTELGIHVDPNRERPPQDIEYQAALYPAGVLVIATVEVDGSVKP